jgi:hypothetical protein
MTELKLCPFCGSEAKLLTMSFDGEKVYGVFCTQDLDAEYQHRHFIDNYATRKEVKNEELYMLLP